MRFKPIPDPPADRSGLFAVHATIPAEPMATDDCCGRLIEHSPVDSREAAADWLVFCRALGLATNTSAGYRREPAPDEVAVLGSAFREHVVDADRVLAVLNEADRPHPATAVADAIRSTDGDGGRERSTVRVERLLEWAVLFELSSRAADGFVVR